MLTSSEPDFGTNDTILCVTSGCAVRCGDFSKRNPYLCIFHVPDFFRRAMLASSKGFDARKQYEAQVAAGSSDTTCYDYVRDSVETFKM